jgi:hypothetical protein
MNTCRHDKRKATPAERHSRGIAIRSAKSTHARLVKTKHLGARALNAHAPKQDAVRNSHELHLDPVTVHRGCALEFAALLASPRFVEREQPNLFPLEASRVRC